MHADVLATWRRPSPRPYHASKSIAGAAALDLHACAGVAAAAVPAPTARSRVARAATPAPLAVFGSELVRIVKAKRNI